METLAQLSRRSWVWLFTVLLLAVIGYRMPPALLNTLETQWLLQAWRWLPLNLPERRVLLVDIDERSLQTLGAWPWSSDKLLQLAQRVQQAGASVQVWDVVLPPPRDAAVLQPLAHHPPVLAQVFGLLPSQTLVHGQAAGAALIECPATFWQAYGVLGNTSGLAAWPTGHITPILNQDGAVTHLPAVVCYHRQSYLSLGLQALAQLAAPPSSQHVWQLQAGSSVWEAPWLLRLPGLGLSVPLDARGQVRLSYRLPAERLWSVSAAALLRGEVRPEYLQGAIVIVGSSALSVGDAVATLQSPHVSGMSVHAQFIAAALDQQLPYTPQFEPWGSLLLAIPLIVGLAWAQRRGRVRDWAWVSVGWSLIVLALAWLFLVLWQWWWQTWALLWLSGLLFSAGIGVGLWVKSAHTGQRLLAYLRSYLPAPFALRLLAQPLSADIVACEQMVCVWFADIRNFTAFCTASTPTQAAQVLHQFFQLSSDIVARHGGTIEAFQGDAVMAVWNAHTPCAAPAQAALSAAQALLAAVPALGWDGLSQVSEPLSVSIGLDSGMALVGTLGARSRRTHAVLGLPVTVAWRLQGLTAELASPLLLGAQAWQQLPVEQQAQCDCLGQFLLEGLTHPQALYAWVSARVSAGV